MSETASRNDPFPAFRFEISLDDLAVAGFSECTGLQIETELQEFQEGGENKYVHRFPTRVKQSNITLKRGIVDREMWDWFAEILDGNMRARTIEINVYDAAKENKMTWQCTEAFPIKMSGPELNAQQNNVAMETVELCYHQLKRIA